MAIVGNKIDLIKDKEEVPYKEAVDYAKELGAIFKYTSAKENKGINVLLHLSVGTLYEHSGEAGDTRRGKTGGKRRTRIEAQAEESRAQRRMLLRMSDDSCSKLLVRFFLEQSMGLQHVGIEFRPVRAVGFVG